MAPLFRLNDGTTQVNLNTSPNLTTDYPMSSPESDEDIIKNLGDGDLLGVPQWKNVTETLQLLLTGATPADVVAQIQSIEKMLNSARQNRLTWRSVKVWLEVQFDQDSGVWWRSEILTGRLVHKAIANDIWKSKVETALIITRRYFFEGALTQVQLTSAGTGSPTTGYVTVYNNDDASANTNWFQVASTQVNGVLPAPLKIEIHNGSGSARLLQQVHLGNYVFMDPTSIDPIMRGSDATSPTTSWTGVLENTTYRWLLAQALMDDLAGQYGRILVAFSSLPASTTLARIRLQQFYPTGSVYLDLVIGEQVKVAGQWIVDLGAMPIPPAGGAASNALTYLTLTMQAATSGGDSFGVDWIQIMPAGDGLYRRLQGVTSNAGLDDGESLIDDGPESMLYIQNGTDKNAAYRDIHTPIHVWPGVTQRFRLMKAGQGSVGAAEVYQVKAWYRPRRLTV